MRVVRAMVPVARHRREVTTAIEIVLDETEVRVFYYLLHIGCHSSRVVCVWAYERD